MAGSRWLNLPVAGARVASRPVAPPTMLHHEAIVAKLFRLVENRKCESATWRWKPSESTSFTNSSKDVVPTVTSQLRSRRRAEAPAKIMACGQAGGSLQGISVLQAMQLLSCKAGTDADGHVEELLFTYLRPFRQRLRKIKRSLDQGRTCASGSRTMLETQAACDTSSKTVWTHCGCISSQKLKRKGNGKSHSTDLDFRLLASPCDLNPPSHACDLHAARLRLSSLASSEPLRKRSDRLLCSFRSLSVNCLSGYKLKQICGACAAIYCIYLTSISAAPGNHLVATRTGRDLARKAVTGRSSWRLPT